MTATTTTYGVMGMTCEHCVKAVTEELTRLPGVSAVTVELAPEGNSTVAVTAAHPLEPAAVRSAVEEAGYELADTSAGAR